ncbi:MAG: TauD/TfdA family dioxygenase [Sphingorhabdus sp.]
MKIERLDGPFGARITGAAPGSISDGVAKELVDALFEHRVLLVEGGEDLPKADYASFGRLFGKPLEFFMADHLDNAFPELIWISNSPDVPLSQRDGAGFWHTDGSYEHLPATVTMLYGVEVPDQGGETKFIDTAAAYDALDDAMKAQIDGLQVWHGLVRDTRTEEEVERVKLDPVFAEKQAREQFSHPMVLPHPVTGRKTLYSPSGSPFGVVGMEEAEGRALLDTIKAHCLQPQFRNTIKCGRGDILIWDNLSTMHSATPTEYTLEDGKRRALMRISTTGLPPAYSGLAAPF